MKRNSLSTGGLWLVRGMPFVILLAAVWFAGCGEKAPAIMPGTAKYMPPELQKLYLGMEKTEVDKYFTAQSTQLTNRGLETATQFIRDSVRIGVACAYRDGRLTTATIWYDYELVPERVDRERQEFLRRLMEQNGPKYDLSSFVMEPGEYVPDIGLIWAHSGCIVASMFSKPSDTFPDTVSFRPYYQFSIFGPPTTPWHLWKNIIIPAEESERSYFREVDSLRTLLRTSRTK